MPIILHEHNNTCHYIDIDEASSISLAAAVYQSGLVPTQALCMGLGRCGACRMRVDMVKAGMVLPPLSPKERDVLSPESIEAGWRLACQIPALDGLEARLPAPPDAEFALLANISGALAFAVDIGTTSIHWKILSLQDGSLVAQGSCLNPQMGSGADVMSRIATALTPEGAHRLQRLVLDTLQRICKRVCDKTGGHIERMVLSGNTAMLAIMTGACVQALAYAPYTIAEKGGHFIKWPLELSKDSIPALPSAWIMPAMSPFVGGDVASGVWYLQKHGLAKHWQAPWLLLDMGTNGECVLVLPDGRLLVSSVPLGPALEGIALACGGVAQAGSIDHVGIDSKGLTYRTLGDTLPVNICATGYISLIALLLQLGIVSQEGTLVAHSAHPLAGKVREHIEYASSGRWRLFVTDSLFLDVLDVEAFLKVKASLDVTMKALLDRAGLGSQEIRHVALAGALGEHVSIPALERCGFVPWLWRERIVAVGNTSLSGAMILASSTNMDTDSTALRQVSNNCELVSLTDTNFMKCYMDAMRFAW